ncbi:MAG: hypothetical protein ACRDIY_19425 [Chloroflexota bacterium]
MNTPVRRIVLVLVGCTAAVILGVATLVGVIGPPAVLSPRAATAGVSHPAPRLAQAPPLTPTPTPAATPRPTVSLALTSFDRQPSLGGVTATITIENRRSSALAFSFDPAYDLKLVDARGNSWQLRWAAYAGSPTVAPNQDRQLANAFFAGPVSSAAAWPLTLTVERVPVVGTEHWRIAQRGAPTPSVDRSAVQAIPTVAQSGPIALTLDDALPSSGLGGIQVDLMVRNQRGTDLVFNFDPNAQIAATDNLGRVYHVRWAQYAGIVRVGPHQTTRLARVFLEGPLADARATWLSVTVHQVPGAPGLRNVVPLQ